MCIDSLVFPFSAAVPHAFSISAAQKRVSVPAGQLPQLVVVTCPRVKPASMGP